MSIYLEQCERIWEGYKLYSGTAFLSRKGFELLGMTKPTDFPKQISETFVERGESCLEHQAKTAWLLVAFYRNFPFFFGEVSGGYVPSDFWRIIATALCHDVGEIAIGDIPDDGNPLHDNKDAAELKMFREMALAFGLDSNYDALVRMFRHFQDKDSPEGKALFILDKLDAVLTQLFLEKNGCQGHINDKAYRTGQDQYFMDMTGTDSPADCWAAHFRTQIQGFPSYMIDIVYSMLEVVVCDVRGRMFTWWGKKIPPYEKK